VPARFIADRKAPSRLKDTARLGRQVRTSIIVTGDSWNGDDNYLSSIIDEVHLQ
jgi:hypothetical protein